MTVFELIEANGLNLHGDIEHFAALVEAAARADEREACLKIIDNYEIPLGNSRTSEISCGMTYGALKDIHDAIRARGTT